MKDVNAVILIGPPGAGKTSIVNNLSVDERLSFIKTGVLLRDEVKRNSETGRKIKKDLESGKLISDEIVTQLIKNKLKNLSAKYIFFDGYPRILEQVVSFFGITKNLKAVFIITLNNPLIFKRLTGRRICPNDGSIFNIYFNPPEKDLECDNCGAKLITRDDDKPEVVEERIKEYEDNTLPIVKFFKDKYSDITYEINGDKNIEDITGEIRTILKL